jgi:hypothetical protein
MNWLKELWWKIRNPLSFTSRTKVTRDFEEGKKKAKRYKEKAQ